MATLTAEQVNQLATHFLEVAQEVGNYRQQQYDKLTATERTEMKELESKILNYSDALYTLSATLVMNDVLTSLTSINSVTTNIKATYKTLQNVQKAINVAASVVTLGAAIMSQNPQAIAESIGGLAQTWAT
jgi:molecular chaperone GrpE (heat shock protein)